MDNILISLITSLIENLVIVQILNYYLEKKPTKTWIFFVILFSVFALMVNTMESPFYLILALMCLICFGMIQYKDSFGYICVACSGVFILNAFLSFALISIIGVYDYQLIEKLAVDPIFYLCMVLISKFLLILVCYTLRLRFNMTDKINWNLIMIELLLFFMALIYSFYVYVKNLVSATDALVMMTIIIAMFGITFYVYTKYFRNIQKQEKIMESFRLTEKEQMLIGLSQDGLHQFKEQVISLNQHVEELTKEYVNDPKIIKLKELLAGIKITQTPIIVNTDNPLLNHILNTKSYMLMGMDIKFKAVFENSLQPINSYDLIALITSFIDHLIEVCKGSDTPRIEMIVTEETDYVKVIMNCNYHKDIEFKDSHIKEIVSRYDGYYEHYIKDGKFIHCIVFHKGGKVWKQS